jgi:hypothetical protein
MVNLFVGLWTKYTGKNKRITTTNYNNKKGAAVSTNPRGEALFGFEKFFCGC